MLEGTGAPDDWDSGAVSSPRALYDAADPTNPYKLYFSATDPAEGSTHVGLAVSSDGLAWTRYEDPLAPGETLKALPAGSAGDLDERLAGTPYVWNDGGVHRMLYRCSDTLESGICAASSDDLGYTWDKWDPAPGAGLDPQPVLTTGLPGAWDQDAVGFPVWLGQVGVDGMLYGGDGGDGWRSGAAHAPWGAEGAVDKLGDLGEVLGPSFQTGRWDSRAAFVSDVREDAGEVTVFYTGSVEDAAAPSGELAHIGRAMGWAPDMVLLEPAADPHAMATGDSLTIAGTVTDDGPLDELLVVISSAMDATVGLAAHADAGGAFEVVAPGGTFVDDPSPYLVSVSAYDAGGLAAVTSVTLEVSP